jgi:hypothetical protein
MTLATPKIMINEFILKFNKSVANAKKTTSSNLWIT